MKAFLTAGGDCDIDFLKKSYNENDYDYVIGIDGGSKYLWDAGIRADLIIGDFDTLSENALTEYEKSGIKVKRFPAEKDETDTELAILEAILANCDEIHLYAAIGTRIDHLFGNIMSLQHAYKKNIKAYIIDKNNRIHIAFKEEKLKKDEQYGKYVSFIPMTASVSGITLEGFMYSLKDAVLTNDKSLAISNQIADNVAKISYKEGILLMIESKD